MKIFYAAHTFPPAGGPGVQRTLKMVKYLSRAGHELTVITALPISYRVRDHGLMREIPQGVRVFRTMTLEPVLILENLSLTGFERDAVFPGISDNECGGDDTRAGKVLLKKIFTSVRAAFRTILEIVETAVFLPDVYAPWLPFALFRTFRETLLHRPDVIVATGPPFSAFVIAYVMNLFFGIPFVLDYRDAWGLNPYRKGRERLKNRISKKLEKLILSRASAIILATPGMKEDFDRNFPDFSSRTHSVLNGFDHEDFDLYSPRSLPPGGIQAAAAEGRKLKMVHTGTFTITRRPTFFLRALARLHARGIVNEKNFELSLAGIKSMEAEKLVKEFSLQSIVRFTGYLEHDESIRKLEEADLLLLVTGPDRSEMTGKVFEYLYAGRPIFACTNPGGALAKILHETGTAVVATWSDVDEIERKLEALLLGHVPFEPALKEIQKYSRKEAAAKLESILKDVTGRSEDER